VCITFLLPPLLKETRSSSFLPPSTPQLLSPPCSLSSDLSTSAGTFEPIEVPLPGPATEIACGWYHGLVLLEDGILWAWGQNEDGKLGIGESQFYEPTPKKVLLEGVKKIACGGHHSLAITENGTNTYKNLKNS
jgi:hypothetical protein